MVFILQLIEYILGRSLSCLIKKTGNSFEMALKKYFVTATDTDAGKTYVTQLIIEKLTLLNITVAAYKPISAGCEVIDNQLINEDAALLTKAANCGQPLIEVNPIAFKEPIAPHIAAKKAGRRITTQEIQMHFDEILKRSPEIVLTEGAGGWRLPLGNNAFLSEFAVESQQAVILVVNMKLGCLNHAILTYETILRDKLNCVGWVANCIEAMPYLDENLGELRALIKAPCLGVLPFEKDTKRAAKNLDVTALI